MNTIIMILMSSMLMGGNVLYDFNSAKTSGQWYIVNDGVMGGVSKSSINIDSEGIATFSGVLSPDNNGGFASIRSVLDKELDSSIQGIVVRIKGDGNDYSMRFRTSKRFDGYSYQARMKTTKDEWTEIKIPFNKFSPTFRGYTLSDKPALEAKDIKQIGIMIADKQWGDFALNIDWIKFY